MGLRNIVRLALGRQAVYTLGNGSLVLGLDEVIILPDLKHAVDELERLGFSVGFADSALNVRGYPFLSQQLTGQLEKLGAGGGFEHAFAATTLLPVWRPCWGCLRGGGAG